MPPTVKNPTNAGRRATGSPPATDEAALTTSNIDPGVVRSRWDIIKRTQLRERREFWINQAFFLDEQYIRWDKGRQVVDRVVFKDPDRLRLTINRIRPNLVTLMAKLLGRELTWDVLPSMPDDPTVAAARLAEQVLGDAHDRQRWETLRSHELMAAFMGGTSAVAVEWDGSAGLDLGVRTEKGRKVGVGDVCLSSLAITEFGLQPGARSPLEARWWVRGVAIPPSQARDQYGLDYLPEPDAVGEQTLVLLYDSSWRPVADRCLVLSYFELPSDQNPDGVVGTVIGGDWVDGGPRPWYFPFTDHLNLSVFRQQEVIGRWSGDTLVASARPVQVAYNHARSDIAEHMKKAGNARLCIPEGSSSQWAQASDDPGEMMSYNESFGKPFYLSPPELPAWMVQHCNDLRQELDDIMFVHDVSRGATDGGESGLALGQMSERDDSPLTLMANDQAGGWGLVGEMVLDCYAKFAEEKRKAVTQGGKGGVPRLAEWDGKMLRSQTQSKVPLDAVLPHSRVAQQAFGTSLWDRKIVTDPGQLANIMDLPNQEEMQEALDADVAKAQRENHLMSLGRPLVPADFDDHAKHIAEHNRFRKSQAYEQLQRENPEAAVDVAHHIQVHENYQHAQAGAQALRAEISPDLPGIAQGHEPPGAGVPTDNAEAQAAAAPQPGPAVPPGPPLSPEVPPPAPAGIPPLGSEPGPVAAGIGG